MLRLALLSLLALPLLAQDRIGTVQVRVSTDHPDWRYQPGQPVRFRIQAIQDGQPSTEFMQVGDTIRIEMKTADGRSIFGAIEQEVVAPVS